MWHRVTALQELGLNENNPKFKKISLISYLCPTFKHDANQKLYDKVLSKLETKISNKLKQTVQ